MKAILLSFLLVFSLNLQASFDDHFLNKTLRLDYYHSGNNAEDSYSFDELIEEPYWGGSKVNLVDIFEYGSYLFKVKDKLSGDVHYSRNGKPRLRQKAFTGPILNRWSFHFQRNR
jgi:hypothetical protein